MDEYTKRILLCLPVKDVFKFKGTHFEGSVYSTLGRLKNYKVSF